MILRGVIFARFTMRESCMIAGLDFLGLHQGRAASEPGGGRGHDRQQRRPLTPTLTPLHQPKVPFRRIHTTTCSIRTYFTEVFKK